MGVLIFFQALFSNQPGHRWGHSGQPGRWCGQPGHRWGHSGQPGLRCDQPGRWCGQPGHRCDQPGLTEYRVRLVYGKDLPVHLDHNLPNPVLRGPQDLTDQDLALNQLLVTVSICLFSQLLVVSSAFVFTRNVFSLSPHLVCHVWYAQYRCFQCLKAR